MSVADLRLREGLSEIRAVTGGFALRLESGGEVFAKHLVVACGGKSIPKMGATGFGYEIAARFGHNIIETRPALVPLTFSGAQKEAFAGLAGVAVDVRAEAGGASFDEAMLFTHRGLSGPAILQISSYWRDGDSVALDLLPGRDGLAALQSARKAAPRKTPTSALAELLPAKLAAHLAPNLGLKGNMADQSDKALGGAAEHLHAWHLTPSGSEGYRTAEVTLGGVNTDGIDAKSMESKHQPGLFFIGEVVDVTGWLGGYNFQWAWSSGVAAGKAIAARVAAG
ncbi:MAG: aminoacetone oxidase family FAD-binding enzyme, partial [Pseudomonadota bacterium]